MKDLYLSIIIPTLGRKNELKALFDSILNTKIACRYEVLVIDQNEDGLVTDICNEYRAMFDVKQYIVGFKGLSRAKNFGIDHANGNVVCFPDDDAEFTANTISVALNKLLYYNADCVFGKCVDKTTLKDSVMKFKTESIKLDLSNFEGAFVEATMFARISLFSKIRYDEKMGVGCIFGSQEGYDLVYRLLKAGKDMYYDPKIIFYHPSKIETKSTDNEIKRAFYYSCGFGYLCKKHGLSEKYKKRLRKLSWGIPIIALIRRKELKYYKAQKMGLMLGHDYLK